jgi:spermidine/putrescine transport system ATP-binding protein
MTVGGNVAYALEVAGVPKAERTRRVAKALELVNLEGLERRKPSQLSGGQQQRVALARAIIAEPKILLLDEPLSALDRRLRQAMQLELKNLQSELGISFVYVTHDQEEALTMSDRIVVLSGGRIQQVGTPTEVYHRPANSFVAEFLGDSNLFDATLVAIEGDRARFETVDGLVLTGVTAGRSIGARVKILLRPENFELAPTGTAAAGAAVLQGRLAQEVFLGTDYHLIVRTDLGDRMIKATVRDAQREGLPQIAPGGAVRLYYQPHRAHVIADAAS